MIRNGDLRQWTGDRNLQRRTRARSDALAGRWAEGAVHSRFEAAMAGLEKAADIVRATRDLFEDVTWLDRLILVLAEAMHEDPFLIPPFHHLNSDIHCGLVVYEDQKISIAAGVTKVAAIAAKKNGPRGRTSVGLSGQVAVFKFVQAGGARLSIWEAPEITSAFTAENAGVCQKVIERDIADGEILVIDGRRQGFVIEHARRDQMVVQASIKLEQAPVAVEYDSASGRYVGCSAADDSASRIQMITTLLRLLGRDGAFDAIADFLRHPSFFVRWHIMRELIAIDAEAALPHLRAMAARDPHPETKRTARRALARVEEIYGLRKAA